MKKRVLVTGVGGYIGSCITRRLCDLGATVLGIDDLSTGHLRQVPEDASLVTTDIASEEATAAILDFNPQVVIHLAAKALVSEGESAPSIYVRNNVRKTELLAKTLLQLPGLESVIFASTCSVYGSGSPPFGESAPLQAANTYARTKLAGERVLRRELTDHRARLGVLRFFNVAGAQEGLNLGEAHFPETHLIPNAIQALLDGSPIMIFGSDFPTPDGFAVRDYIHVVDISRAIEKLLRSRDWTGYLCLNLGSGKPLSVLQLTSKLEALTGKSLLKQFQARRAGDPPALFADASTARSLLGWVPKHSSIENILNSSLSWMSSSRYQELREFCALQ